MSVNIRLEAFNVEMEGMLFVQLAIHKYLYYKIRGAQNGKNDSCSIPINPACAGSLSDSFLCYTSK